MHTVVFIRARYSTFLREDNDVPKPRGILHHALVRLAKLLQRMLRHDRLNIRDRRKADALLHIWRSPARPSPNRCTIHVELQVPHLDLRVRCS